MAAYVVKSYSIKYYLYAIFSLNDGESTSILIGSDFSTRIDRVRLRVRTICSRIRPSEALVGPAPCQRTTNEPVT